MFELCWCSVMQNRDCAFIFIANRGTINNGEHDDMRGAKVGAREKGRLRGLDR
jgi:hypothetical protein